MNYNIYISFFLCLLLFTGCKDSVNATITQNIGNDSLKELSAENQRLKNELLIIQNTITKERQQSEERKVYIDTLTREYEDLFFLICKERNSHCPAELKYFDPRKVNIGDSVLGLTVAEISVGTGDPGSYSLSFEGVVEVSGKINLEQDDQRGTYLSLETTTINDHKYNIQLSISGNQEELNEAIEGSENREAHLLIKNIHIQNLPHKPAYNSAIFVGIKNSQGFISETTALKIAQASVNDDTLTWHAELKIDEEIEINNVKEKYTVWIIEAKFPAGNKETYRIDAKNGQILVLTETEAGGL